MRIRHIRGAEEYIGAHPLTASEPERCKGCWAAEAFSGEKPIELEIGCGMGAFLRQMSLRHPEKNFIGIELNSTVLYKAIRRYEAALSESGTEAPGNLLFIRSDARLIGEYFSPGEISAVYIHFPDPWPKDKNAGKRLTSPRFLALYGDILAPSGTLSLRTDNQGLFSYSLETLASCGWELCDTGDPCFDEGHGSDILTEYETKWMERGADIYRLRAGKR